MPLRASTSDKILLWYLRRTGRPISIPEMAKGIAQLETEAQFTICNLNPTDPKVNYVLSMNLDLLLEMGVITISEEKVVTLTSLGEHIAELLEPTSLVVEAQKRLVDSVSQTTATSNP